MKYIKTYEKSLTHTLVSGLVSEIIEVVTEYSFQDSDEDFDDCPFTNELALIYQRDYISDFYWNSFIEYHDKVTENQFINIYNKLLIKAEDKILKEITNDPSLYGKWKDWINLQYNPVPDWLIDANKYNIT